MTTLRHWLSANQVLLALLVLAASVYTLWVMGTLPWRMPDEPAHFTYLQNLSREGSIPVPNRAYYYPDQYESRNRTNFLGVFGAEVTNVNPAAANLEINSAAAHPPLYYLLMFPAYRIAEGRAIESQVYFVRMTSLVIFLALIVVSYRFARLLFPDAVYLQAGIPTLMILHPQLAYISSGVMIDGLQALLFTFFLYQLVFVIRGDLRLWRAALAGLAMGLGMLTKSSSVLALPVAFTALAVLFAAKKGQRLAVARAGVVMLLASIAVYGWYPVRNQLQVGYVQDWAGNGAEADGWWFLWFATNFRAKLLASFLGFFSWQTIPLNEKVYHWFRRVTELAAMGVMASLALGYLRRRWRILDIWTAALFAGVWAVFYLGATYFESTLAGAQGRYLFPAIFPFWALILVGLTGWMPPAWRPRAAALVVAAAAVFSAWALIPEFFPRMA